MTTRDRIRTAIGPCAGVCPERQAELVLAKVTSARRSHDLVSDLQSRAAALASQKQNATAPNERSLTQ